jgi:hypothetical protein
VACCPASGRDGRCRRAVPAPDPAGPDPAAPDPAAPAPVAGDPAAPAPAREPDPDLVPGSGARWMLWLTRLRPSTRSRARATSSDRSGPRPAPSKPAPPAPAPGPAAPGPAETGPATPGPAPPGSWPSAPAKSVSPEASGGTIAPQSRHSTSPSRLTRCTLEHREHRSRSAVQSAASWHPGQIRIWLCSTTPRFHGLCPRLGSVCRTPHR